MVAGVAVVVGVGRADWRGEGCVSFGPVLEACVVFGGVVDPLALLMFGGRAA